jgi:hypothetical protein
MSAWAVEQQPAPCGNRHNRRSGFSGSAPLQEPHALQGSREDLGSGICHQDCSQSGLGATVSSGATGGGAAMQGPGYSMPAGQLMNSSTSSWAAWHEWWSGGDTASSHRHRHGLRGRQPHTGNSTSTLGHLVVTLVTLAALLASGVIPGAAPMLAAAQSCPSYTTSLNVQTNCTSNYNPDTCFLFAFCLNCDPLPSTIFSFINMNSCPSRYVDVDCTGRCIAAPATHDRIRHQRSR